MFRYRRGRDADSRCIRNVFSPRWRVFALRIGVALLFASAGPQWWALPASGDSVVIASGRNGSAQKGTLKAGIAYGDAGMAERLRVRAGKALALASHFDNFECRLASEVLNCARSADLVLEGPFQDVLLDIPVSGQAHLKGSLRLATVPDKTCAALELHVVGTVDLRGAGETQGVRLDSDATSRFHAVKRLQLTHTGAQTWPAACRVESSMVFTGIRSRPRLLGRLVERVARQRAADDKYNAERETSEHVGAAILAVVDREVDQLAQAINRAIREHLAGANEAQIATWQRTSFRSDADCVSIGRYDSGTAMLTAWQRPSSGPLPPVLLRLPRATFGLDQMLAALHLIGPSPARKTAPETSESALSFRPSVSWQEKTVTVAVDLEPRIRLAQEPAIGAAQ
jgi:hypothetical protein